MRNSTAYFAGVATVFTATALGFGGSLLLTSATAPRSPPEPTKLERSVAAPAQAAPSPDTRSAASSDAASPQAANQAQPAAAAQAQQAAQVPAQAAPSPQPPSSTQPQAQPLSTTTASDSDQSTVTRTTRSPADAYARSTDEDVRKYIRKRDRRLARRHNRGEDVVTSQTSNVLDQSNSQSPTQSSSTQQGASPQQASSAQSGASGSVESEIKAPDQASVKADNADTRRAKRKHDRRWARGNARDNDDDLRGDNRGQPLDVRETPRDEGPPFFAGPRWRPFFSGNDDD